MLTEWALLPPRVCDNHASPDSGLMTGTDKHFDKKDFYDTMRSWQFWYFSIQYFFLTNSLKYVSCPPDCQ